MKHCNFYVLYLISIVIGHNLKQIYPYERNLSILIYSPKKTIRENEIRLSDQFIYYLWDKTIDNIIIIW